MSHVFAHKPAKLKPRCNRGVKFIHGLVVLLLFFVVGLAHAQVIAEDDSFGIPGNVLSGEPFIVEALGVLENDTLNGNTDVGLTAELVHPPSNGTLFCPGPGGGLLCANGSFEYTPGAGFSGNPCIFQASCESGWHDRGPAGFIMSATQSCPFGGGGDYGDYWKWCHPRLCCNW